MFAAKDHGPARALFLGRLLPQASVRRHTSAASASRLITKPRSTRPPARTHWRSSVGTSLQRPAFTRLRSVLARKLPAPRLMWLPYLAPNIVVSQLNYTDMNDIGARFNRRFWRFGAFSEPF